MISGVHYADGGIMNVDTDGNGSLANNTASDIGLGALFNVTSSASGTILGQESLAPNGVGTWAGFQVASVPEPSTLVLLASGLIGLLCYAWRKRS